MDVMKGSVLAAHAPFMPAGNATAAWPVAALGPEAAWEMAFKHAAASNYLGNLVFRLAHNVVFACLAPRQRVYVSLGAMGCSMSALGLGVYVGGGTSLLWVYFACAAPRGWPTRR
jgi:hypothetical protein